MSDGRNLWIGALLGILLTGGLMFALYQQSGIAGAERKAVEKAVAVKPEASAVFAPVKTKVVNPEAPVQAKSTEESSVATVSTDMGVLGEDSVPSPELIVLPDGLGLSSEALNEMTLSEREQYEKALRSYREVQSQLLALDQERVELKQRMESMFERNDSMEREIERMRAVLQQLPEKTN